MQYLEPPTYCIRYDDMARHVILFAPICVAVSDMRINRFGPCPIPKGTQKRMPKDIGKEKIDTSGRSNLIVTKDVAREVNNNLHSNELLGIWFLLRVFLCFHSNHISLAWCAIWCHVCPTRYRPYRRIPIPDNNRQYAETRIGNASDTIRVSCNYVDLFVYFRTFDVCLYVMCINATCMAVLWVTWFTLHPPLP